MKLEISRHPSVMERGAFAGMVSARAGQSLAEIMQYVGISSITLAERRTMLGNCLAVQSVEAFDGVPQDLSYYMRSLAEGIARCMEEFGISKLSLQPDAGDAEALSGVWSDIVSAQAEPRRESVVTPGREPEKGCGGGSKCRCGKGGKDCKKEAAGDGDDSARPHIPKLMTP